MKEEIIIFISSVIILILGVTFTLKLVGSASNSKNFEYSSNESTTNTKVTTNYNFNTISTSNYSKTSKTSTTKLNNNTTTSKTSITNNINNEEVNIMNIVNDNYSIYNEILFYTNEYRESANLNDLIFDINLAKSATMRAVEMAKTNIFSHTRPDGRNFNTVCSDIGISCFGENVGYGYTSSKLVVDEWYNSKSHRDNMLFPNYKKLGVGYYKYNNRIYWVQLFA